MTPKERYADIKRTYYKDYRPAVDGTPPTQVVDPGYPPANTRYKPILKNRNQRVGDSKGQHITFREPPSKNKSARLTLSILSGLLFGLVLFCWMFFCLDYPLFVAVVAAGCVGVLLCIIFALSRLCRCTAALLLPSVCTTRGRIAFLILITGFLLEGPVTNVYHNMAEVSRSMACSAEQSYNQTMLLLKPFDAMMVQLNSTIVRLQRSSHEVSTGLAPLDAGLDKVEMDIENGHIQLRGTQKVSKHRLHVHLENNTSCKGEGVGAVIVRMRLSIRPSSTCRTMVDQAYNSCSSGIHSAQEQYICQPLDTTSVCNALNDSRMLCLPSSWAGEAIQDAINMTQNAMHSLRDTLQFRVQYEPYYNTRVNASRVIYEIRRKVQQEFGQRTAYFEEVIALLKKLIPVALILLIYVSYLHIRHYMCRDTYDNVYITAQFRGLDQKRAEVAGDHLLPLKKYERLYLVNTSSCDLSAPEDGLYRTGLCVLMLHLGISFCCFMFDFILFWVLALVRRHGHPEFDFTGRESLDFVVTGEGVIVDLLNIFLRGFHPGHWFGFTANNQACLPAPRSPSLSNLVVIFVLYLALLLSVLLKAYLLRLRNLLTGFFYPEREKARIVHLYNVILNQRARMTHLLHQRAKISHRERALQEQVGFCHQVATRCAPCRPFLYDATRCLVCGSVEDQTFRDCETERCQGVYCFDCFEDLGNICPLCLQGDYSDEEDYEELEDDLQPYCRSSKIYL
ncbi:hypothetical protein CAPTEDRAFT_146494 [Capitella teleta]|uniref:Uncharacterized protein n=1 Tax=Capitella teleta TaxID=283909 RepID=R7THI1_CAPTE|nr:hypothetical protein CAPTEDRAFT_146494 [Capitella teleta]|eukprot:ELT92902.1 hypothetical protein CAPTEDRAFT_146494 [Capitella teleta]